MRGVIGASGLPTERSTYRPFGEQDEVVSGTPVAETKGFIGERYDADAGLQYLNARYYDPKLGLFLQPDWFEVTEAGVGTNRFAYAGNDPVNASDPGGNGFFGDLGRAIRDFLGGGNSGPAARSLTTTTKRPVYTQRAVHPTPYLHRQSLPENIDDVVPVQFDPDDILTRGLFRGIVPTDPPLQGAGSGGGGAWKPSWNWSGNSAARPSASVESGGIAKGGTYTLRESDGTIVKNGRTGNLAQRQKQHSRDPNTADLRFREESRTDSYAAQRGLEQMQMDVNRGPLDRIRGIAIGNPRYSQYIDAARRYLGELLE